jgi:hypothetical protein
MTCENGLARRIWREGREWTHWSARTLATFTGRPSRLAVQRPYRIENQFKISDLMQETTRAPAS